MTLINIKSVTFLLIMSLGCSYLFGCTTLDKNECLNADWTSIGYQDGYKGRDQSRIGRHQKACAEYNVKPNLTEYLRGHQKGIYEYCEPSRGYQRGTKGYSNKGICTGTLRIPYNIAYSEGRKLYLLEQDKKKTLNVIEDYNDALISLKHERESTEQQLINHTLTKIERERLVNKLRVLDEDKQFTHDAIHRNEEILDNISSEIEELKTHSHF